MWSGIFAHYVLSGGLFALSGGLTNWIAVKMLFDRIPGLIGSGVIPAHFVEIRAAVKRMVMRMFFETEFLKHYLRRSGPQLLQSLHLGPSCQLPRLPMLDRSRILRVSQGMKSPVQWQVMKWMVSSVKN